MRNPRKFVLILAILAILTALYFLFLYDQGTSDGEDPEVLVGTWVRTDNPYKMVVSSFKDDGTLDASYLNPQSINVAIAKWEVYENQLYMYIELQDVNYPGSNYTLIFNPETKTLQGDYYQAIADEIYRVEFAKD